jgi:hypothetical protein
LAVSKPTPTTIKIAVPPNGKFCEAWKRINAMIGITATNAK